MQQVSSSFLDEFKRITPNSAKLNEAAKRCVSGGVSRNSLYFEPYPIYAKKARGCRTVDVDDNERIDLLNNFGPLILGHNDPRVVAAVRAQLEQGESFDMASELEMTLAEKISEACPCVESLKFSVSGTEAVMNVIRAARAYTGKTKIAKFEGQFNGTCDSAEVSVSPPLDKAGPIEKPNSVPEFAGITDATVEDVITLPWNDLEHCESVIRSHRDDLAGVMLNPIGRINPPDRDFLKGLREVTSRYDTLLIFDEVITGFRIAYGGAQEYYGVIPDLATYGKIIGGGYPLGAFGGRVEIMHNFDPSRKTKQHVQYSGTFYAHPISLVAGIETLAKLTKDVYERLNSYGDHLRSEIQSVLDQLRIQGTTVGVGSLIKPIYFGVTNTRNYRETVTANQEMDWEFGIRCLCKGLYFIPGGSCFLSTPMSKEDMNAIIDSMTNALQELASQRKV